MMLENTGKV